QRQFEYAARLLLTVAEQPIDYELGFLDQMRGLQGQGRDAAAVQRQDADEMKERMPQLEGNDFALLQPRPQDGLGRVLDALDQLPVSRHAAGEDDRRFIGTQLRLELDLLEPTHVSRDQNL